VRASGTWRPRSLAAAVALALCPASAVAAAVQVSPTRVDLSPSARSAVVTLRNDGAEPVSFEVQVRGWRQSAAGEMELSSTSELVAYPPVLALAPGEERNLRVGVTSAAPFGSIEKSYRLLVQELPSPEKQGSPLRVRVLTQLNIPVFLAPARTVKRASLQDLGVREGKVIFTARNEGTVHVRAGSVKLAALASDGKALVERDLAPLYLLAGGERLFEVEVPADVCARVREVSVAAALEPEVLRARMATPEGVCAR
jgi:fimbrial chaperone protein